MYKSIAILKILPHEYLNLAIKKKSVYIQIIYLIFIIFMIKWYNQIKEKIHSKKHFSLLL